MQPAFGRMASVSLASVRVRTGRDSPRGMLHSLHRYTRAQLVLGLGLAGGCNVPYTEITSGFDILPTVRPALANDGTVVAAEAERLLVGNGDTLTPIDLAPFDLFIGPGLARRSVQVRSEGDLVFVANRTGVADCLGAGRGAYRLTTAGGPLTVLREGCPADPGPAVGQNIALSANGTVAVSDIRNGQGAIHRGPATGPLSILRSGTSEFYNVGNASGLDVNDLGRVAAQLEYFDGIAGGLMRGILLFETPEQPKAEIGTAIEKLGIGISPPVAINASGTVAFSLNSSVTIPIGGITYTYAAGVYVATPTLFDTPKSLVLVAGLTGPYCGFGTVDINDAGTVAFEARIDGELGCNDGSAYDGIFTGADPTATAVVVRGDEALESHQFFDSVVLGEINASGQVSFITTYSEPLVPPIIVWRAN